jgi:thioesterase domain-containing protein
MTDKQPEALRLADAVCDYTRWGCETPEAATLRRQKTHKEAAAELRRLHEVNAELVEALQFALDVLAAQDEIDQVLGAAIVTAEAAIAKATGEQQ